MHIPIPNPSSERVNAERLNPRPARDIARLSPRVEFERYIDFGHSVNELFAQGRAAPKIWPQL
jgi:hypothetical protein